MNERQVVVTTSTRDVWTGRAAEDAVQGQIVLLEARHVFYWDMETGGLGGLAARGPGKGSRLGPPIKRAQISNVVTVLDCSEEATTRIVAAGWAK